MARLCGNRRGIGEEGEEEEGGEGEEEKGEEGEEGEETARTGSLEIPTPLSLPLSVI